MALPIFCCSEQASRLVEIGKEVLYQENAYKLLQTNAKFENFVERM